MKYIIHLESFMVEAESERDARIKARVALGMHEVQLIIEDIEEMEEI